jgi:hypothetical protein
VIAHERDVARRERAEMIEMNSSIELFMVDIAMPGQRSS